jgi:hypothetical protein
MFRRFIVPSIGVTLLITLRGRGELTMGIRMPLFCVPQHTGFSLFCLYKLKLSLRKYFHFLVAHFNSTAPKIILWWKNYWKVIAPLPSLTSLTYLAPQG